MNDQFRVAVLVACHNRRAKTTEAIQSLLAAKPESWDLRFYLADDGSTDGTSEAVEALPVSVKIVRGEGDWYWAHSMYQAELIIDEPHDAILWLNDDIVLNPAGLEKFEQVNALHPSTVLVGQFCDPDTQELTYGGMQSLGRHPFQYTTEFAAIDPLLVDTMNGNLVLIPRVVSEAVGTIDGGFAHAYADMDFGLRARSAGFQVLAVPGFSGTCARNIIQKHSSVRARIKALNSKKGTPPASQIRYLRRHGGFTWPIYFVSPYVRAILTR